MVGREGTGERGKERRNVRGTARTRMILMIHGPKANRTNNQPPTTSATHRHAHVHAHLEVLKVQAHGNVELGVLAAELSSSSVVVVVADLVLDGAVHDDVLEGVVAPYRALDIDIEVRGSLCLVHQAIELISHRDEGTEERTQGPHVHVGQEVLGPPVLMLLLLLLELELLADPAVRIAVGSPGPGHGHGGRGCPGRPGGGRGRGGC